MVALKHQRTIVNSSANAINSLVFSVELRFYFDNSAAFHQHGTQRDFGKENSCSVDTMMLPKLLMGFSAAAGAANYVYQAYLLDVYFKVSLETIGMFQSLNPIISLFALPTAMWLSDRYFSLKSVMMVCTLLGAISYGMNSLIPPDATSGKKEFLLLLLTIASSLTLSSVGSMIDAITMQIIHDEKDYGKQRLWASIAWGMGSFLTGYLVEKTGNPLFIIYVYLFFISLFMISSSFIDLSVSDTSSHAVITALDDDHNEYGLEDDIEDDIQIVGEDTRLLHDEEEVSNDKLGDDEADCASLFDVDVLLFLFSFNLIGMTFSILGSYLFIYFKNTWFASPTLLGSTTIPSILWELPIFYYSSFFLQWLGPDIMTVLSLFLLFLRLTLYIVLPNVLPLPSGWNVIILLLESLHGACFALSWAAGMDHIQKIAPPKRKAAWIGIFCSIYNNLGGIVGNLVGGIVYDRYGYIYLWSGCILIILVALVFYIASVHFYKKRTSAQNQ